jgi:hypothetical protein
VTATCSSGTITGCNCNGLGGGGGSQIQAQYLDTNNGNRCTCVAYCGNVLGCDIAAQAVCMTIH